MTGRNDTQSNLTATTPSTHRGSRQLVCKIPVATNGSRAPAPTRARPRLPLQQQLLRQLTPPPSPLPQRPPPRPCQPLRGLQDHPPCKPRHPPPHGGIRRAGPSVTPPEKPRQPGLASPCPLPKARPGGPSSTSPSSPVRRSPEPSSVGSGLTCGLAVAHRGQLQASLGPQVAPPTSSRSPNGRWSPGCAAGPQTAPLPAPTPAGTQPATATASLPPTPPGPPEAFPRPQGSVYFFPSFRAWNPGRGFKPLSLHAERIQE